MESTILIEESLLCFEKSPTRELQLHTLQVKLLSGFVFIGFLQSRARFCEAQDGVCIYARPSPPSLSLPSPLLVSSRPFPSFPFSTFLLTSPPSH